MKMRDLIAGFIFAAMSVFPAIAQPAAAPSSGTAKPPEWNYILGPEDVLDVDAPGRTDFSIKAKIGTDGTIQLPFLGTVAAANKSTEQLREDIVQALKKGGYFPNPIVHVEVVSYASRYVTVLGQFNNPGLITIDRPYRLSEIIARVGGIRPEGADYVIIRSNNGPQKALDIKDLATGDANSDPYVQPGDKLYSPKADTFYIKGQVKAPGAYAISSNMTLTMALAKGGGLTDLGSDSHIKIIRKKETITPDNLNITVEPDDVIDVGEGWL